MFQERRDRMTVDEKRFFDICRSLGHRPVRKEHFVMLGDTEQEAKAVCLHCKMRYS